jgi:hypothetical protein
MWLAILAILGWMFLVAILMLAIDKMFGSPVESIHFGANDIFGLVDPAVLRAAFARLRDGKQTSPAHLVLMFIEGVGTLDRRLFRRSRPLQPVSGPATEFLRNAPSGAFGIRSHHLGLRRDLLPEGHAVDQPVWT